MKSTSGKIVGGIAITILAAAFLAAVPSQASAQQIYVEPGDIVLSINGQSIGGRTDLINAVNRSGSVMRFTVQDRRTGRILYLATRLNDNGYRFGVSCVDNGGRGARITNVIPGASALRCWNEGGGAIGTVSRPTYTTPRYTIPRNIRPGSYVLPDGTPVQVD